MRFSAEDLMYITRRGDVSRETFPRRYLNFIIQILINALIISMEMLQVLVASLLNSKK